ncbi:LPCAT3 [Cordylochernes scorpioides]|uniref:Lysophospholipid acyltransferase 5 n=1 Tax=Cordylochernes scorpioides TaxID=51811 RepID=A0ABY6KJI2_9ARAC|nr:LPCAT3 [Cordylochernes scorpioides]
MYLLTAYFYTSSRDYDIKWTLPHCVITLRLIALAFNVYDGTKKFDQLSEDQKKTALHRTPSLLEISGYCYFFGGFMVGPQFSMTQYLSFVHKRIPPNAFSGKPSCFFAAFSKLFLGLLVLAVYQLGVTILPEMYVMTYEFEEKHFFYKILIIGLWGKICLYKYVACWLLSEGSCILTGLTYNGEDKKGNILWNGCTNIDLLDFEKTITFNGIIRSFNINTNQWVSQYVFKRLKFLGSKLMSQFLSLIFLAMWHGLHTGYYICFFNEFIVMKMERDIQNIVENSQFLTRIVNNFKYPIYFLMKIYLTCVIGYCLLPFILLTTDRWYGVYSSVYFYGHIIYLTWPVLYFFASLFKGKNGGPEIIRPSEIEVTQ